LHQQHADGQLKATRVASQDRQERRQVAVHVRGGDVERPVERQGWRQQLAATPVELRLDRRGGGVARPERDETALDSHVVGFQYPG
jgi:hypothetical protein